MNICGVLVHANPKRLPVVLDGLSALDGVEVHATAEEGRIVVTVEDTEGAPAIDTLTRIHRLDGIVAAALVYHYCEPAEAAGHTREEARRP